MNVRDIEITLDEVVLDGPFGARAEALREAVEAELGRIVAERGLPAGAEGRHVPRVAIDVPPELGAEAVAARVAGAIYERLAAPSWHGARAEARGGGR
jgi:hypothetical protein